MFEEAGGGYSTATDVAEYLVTQGVPFRKAHNIVGRLVGYCLENKKEFHDLTLDEISMFHDPVDDAILGYFSARKSPDRRSTPGGTAREAVLQRIREIGEDNET